MIQVLATSGGRHWRIFLLSALSILLTHCRMTRDTGTLQPSRTSSLAIKGDGLAPQANLKPFRDDDLEDVVWVAANTYPGAPTEIRGFDGGGYEIRCLPIRDDTQCLKKANAWRERCLAEGGVIKRCQDCRELCDKPLGR